MLGPHGASPDVLVGLDEADDAAVVRLGPADALVLTVDFFTPLVDDAFTWGQIAAANATSDVYAMGGRPLFALNIAGWPRDTLPLSLLAEVLRGGHDVAQRAGMLVVGGHTVDDPEPKYGMCVVGRADPERLLTLEGARPGDLLVLTKPIGTGIITTALKRDGASTEAVDAAVASMIELNEVAAEALLAAGTKACTDVTGFGLVGHLHRLLRASGVSGHLDAGSVPLLPSVRDLAQAGFVPGGTERNLAAVEDDVDWDGLDVVTRTILCDAQTSGGLLAAVREPPAGADAVVIGRVGDGRPGWVEVRR